MKRHVVFIALLLIVVYPCRSQYDNTSFKLFSNDLRELVLNTGTINEDTILTIGIDTPIYGLSISGVAVVPNEDSFVRIVLKGTDGKEYLVYEANNLLSSASSSTLSNVGIETLYLDGVVPESLLLYVIAGSIALDKLHYVSTVPTQNARSSSVLSSSENRTRQAEAIVEQLNVNLKNQNKLWRAGITDIALMSYEEKKVLFGDTIPNLKGLEYYRGGVFKLSDISTGNSFLLEDVEIESEAPTVVNRNSNSPYIHEFDWRNRHGKNWITPVKEQYGYTCWTFAPVALTEAYMNLYYNRILNYDLSEQEIISCLDENYRPHYNGGSVDRALNYIKSKGIVDEACFPLSPLLNETSTCDEKGNNPQDIVTIEGYRRIFSYNEDTYKRMLIKHPIGFSCWNSLGGHSVILVGYKNIEAGDVIYYDPVTGNDSITVDENNELCGKTAWILKNSWGNGWGYDGFGYCVTDRLSSKAYSYITGEIFSEVYTNDDIACEDADNDGYFWWGIGDRPANIPSWAQEEADGDDSNPLYGSMDEYGHLSMITSESYPEIVINTNTIWSEDDYIYNNVRVVNGGKLTISANIKKYFTSSITIENGGELIVDNGSIARGSVVVRDGGHLLLINNGMIQLDDADNLRVELGGIFKLLFGKIEIMD